MDARPGEGKKKSKVSRLEQFRAEEAEGADRNELIMPWLDAGDHLATLLYRVGPTVAGDGLTYQELAAWQQQTGVDLNAWEVETLKVMSSAYAAEYRAAEDPKRVAPFTFIVAAPTPARKEKQVDALFAALERWAKQDGG